MRLQPKRYRHGQDPPPTGANGIKKACNCRAYRPKLGGDVHPVAVVGARQRNWSRPTPGLAGTIIGEQSPTTGGIHSQSQSGCN